MPKDVKKAAAKTSKRSKNEDAAPKQRKAKKDPNAPKRALSAYMFYSQEVRETVKQENPDATFGEMGKLLGERWKQLDDKDKQVYNDMAVKDKKRYEAAKAAYESKPQKKESADEESAEESS